MNVLNLTETTENDLWARGVKAVVVILCGVIPAIVLGMYLVRSLTEGPSAGETVKYGAISALLLLAPVALYAALIRTKVPVVLFGAGLVAIETWSIWNAYTLESSTAGLAILWIPFAGVPFVLLGWAADVWIRAMRRPLSPQP
jgi:hypothetical protein